MLMSNSIGWGVAGAFGAGALAYMATLGNQTQEKQSKKAVDALPTLGIGLGGIGAGLGASILAFKGSTNASAVVRGLSTYVGGPLATAAIITGAFAVAFGAGGLFSALTD